MHARPNQSLKSINTCVILISEEKTSVNNLENAWLCSLRSKGLDCSFSLEFQRPERETFWFTSKEVEGTNQ